MTRINKLLHTAIILSAFTLAACEEKATFDATKAKQTQAVQASVYTSKYAPSATDLDLVKSAGEGNVRRVKSLLNDKKAFLTSADAEGNTAIMSAAKHGQLDILDELIDFGANNLAVLDSGNKEGQTALHIATEAGNVQTITRLREGGANVNIYDLKRNTPLHVAAMKGNADTTQALLSPITDKPPTNPDVTNTDGKTAAHIAAEAKNIPVLKVLAQYQADFNISDIQGYTPLMIAIKQDNNELIEFLLASGANINNISSSEKTGLIYAIENDKSSITKLLLDKGANPNIHASGLATGLQTLVNRENADPDIIQYMISKGAKLKDETMPLGNVISRSIHKGNSKAIEVLIKNGALVSDLETNYSNGIFLALEADDEDIAKLMINNGADLNKQNETGFSPLALAAKNGQKNTFIALVEKGADINKGSKNSAAIPLDIVIDKNDAEMLEILLQKGLKAGADPILLRAATEDKFALIPVALKHGARPDIMNTINQPVLWLVASKGNLEGVKQLVEAGGSLEVKDNDKKLTPLAVAIIKRHEDIANYLIEKGAQPDNGDSNNITPLAYAAVTGQESLLRKLIEKGGNVNALDKGGRSVLKLLDASRLDKAQKENIRSILTQSGAQ